MPGPLVGAAGATGLDGRIYVFGGFQTASGAPTAVAYAYTPASSTWTTVRKMPIARAGHAAVTGADGRIYVIGGVTTYASDGSFVADRRVDIYTP